MLIARFHVQSFRCAPDFSRRHEVTGTAVETTASRLSKGSGQVFSGWHGEIVLRRAPGLARTRPVKTPYIKITLPAERGSRSQRLAFVGSKRLPRRDHNQHAAPPSDLRPIQRHQTVALSIADPARGTSKTKASLYCCRQIQEQLVYPSSIKGKAPLYWGSHAACRILSQLDGVAPMAMRCCRCARTIVSWGRVNLRCFGEDNKFGISR
jgi:hypothetical protein